MKRQHIAQHETLGGYNALAHGRQVYNKVAGDWAFRPHQAFDGYYRMPKGLTDEEGGKQLEQIAHVLKDEQLPGYLDVAGSAAAEAALTLQSEKTTHRIKLLDLAEDCWQRGILAQEKINHDPKREWQHEDSETFRFALNLAFAPLMKALVTGNVTPSVIERTFADTLAIAQAASLQRALAFKEGNNNAANDLLGFGHECNALLTLLYMNDPRHLPLPSSARGGSGYDYPEHTHDIMVINQHWGDILKVVPIEVKAKASRRDLRRYKALVVRGKMHLSVTGKYAPEHTLEAFRQVYEDEATPLATQTVKYAVSTMHELLQLYQKGERISLEEFEGGTTIRFHDRSILGKTYHELADVSTHQPEL